MKKANRPPAPRDDTSSDRSAILERRRRLVATALTGIALGSCETPAPHTCLSPIAEPPPQDAGVDAEGSETPPEPSGQGGGSANGDAGTGVVIVESEQDAGDTSSPQDPPSSLASPDASDVPPPPPPAVCLSPMPPPTSQPWPPKPRPRPCLSYVPIEPLAQPPTKKKR